MVEFRSAELLVNKPELLIGCTTLRPSWRLRSWLPGHMSGGGPVKLGQRVLPVTVGIVTSDAPRILSVGPAEWLLLAEDDVSFTMPRADGLAVVTVRHAWSGYAIRGAGSKSFLGRSCALDFGSFEMGRCARTRFAGVTVVLSRFLEEEFSLYAPRSFDAYLSDWLVDAAETYLG